MKEKLNILLLSGRMPYEFSGLGADLIKSLTQAGHNVQFGFDGIEKILSEIRKPSRFGVINKWYNGFHYYFRKYLNSLVDFLPPIKEASRDGMTIYNYCEEKPRVSVELIVDRINGNFDLCIFLFDHGMFTAKTYKAIYDKFHCPIIINAVDLLPITGGCYYFGKCDHYLQECGYCPIMGGLYRNDQTHKNYLFKKKVYDSIECAFFGNTWMIRNAEKNGILKHCLMKNISFNLDENVFKPLDIATCREHLGIPESKKYIFLYRYRRGNWRKGMGIMEEGVNNLYNTLTPSEREKVLIVLISERCENASDVFKLDVLQLGYIDDKALIEAYNAATAFLCSSIEDAGPSMINQSMACGTPVVAFDTGTAIDVIDDGVNGFKVPLTAKENWGDGLIKLCRMSDEAYIKMRREARKTAMEKNSLGVYAKAVEDVYKYFRPDGKK